MASATRPKVARGPRTAPARPRRTARRPRLVARPEEGAVSSLRSQFGLTRRLLSRLTGLSERTLATWEAGGKVGESALRAVTGAERLLQALAEVVRREAIASWLERPSDGFDGLKPVEVIERGHADRIWKMIYYLGSGSVS